MQELSVSLPEYSRDHWKYRYSLRASLPPEPDNCQWLWLSIWIVPDLSVRSVCSLFSKPYFHLCHSLPEVPDHREQRLLHQYNLVKLNKYVLGAVDTEVSKTAVLGNLATESVDPGPAQLTSLVRSAESQFSSQTCCIRICFSTGSSEDSYTRCKKRNVEYSSSS